MHACCRQAGQNKKEVSKKGTKGEKEKRFTSSHGAHASRSSAPQEGKHA